MSELKTGDAAIAFCLPDGHEKQVCLEDFKGRWLVLYFYPKDQTPGCSLEAGEFTRRLGDFHGLGAEVIGVSPDSPKSHCSRRSAGNCGCGLARGESRRARGRSHCRAEKLACCYKPAVMERARLPVSSMDQLGS